MTTQPNASSRIQAAIALLNVVGGQFRRKKASDSQKRILADIVEVQHGLIGAQNLLAHLEAENARLQKVNEQPVTFGTQDMIAAIEKEVSEAAK